MKIVKLSDAECKNILDQIVSIFGDSRRREGGYIFEAITRLPSGLIEKKLTAVQVIERLKTEAEVLVVFDPCLGNKPSRLGLLHNIGIDEDVGGLRIQPADLPRFFSSIGCDFYVIAEDGSLLCVASHEDEIREGERVMWCPIRRD